MDEYYYLYRELELIYFSRAQKYLVIAAIVLAILLVLKIVLKDFDKLKSTKKLINIFFIIAIGALAITFIYFCVRYYPVYLYQHDNTAWEMRILDKVIKAMESRH